MEININCDLGEKSKLHSNENDPALLEIVNSANVACGYHAGDEDTMREVIKISKNRGVSIGAHPSFNDPDNFGRERMNLSENEIRSRFPWITNVLMFPENKDKPWYNESNGYRGWAPWLRRHRQVRRAVG